MTRQTTQMDDRAWLIFGDNKDCYTQLGIVQAIICDPPYGMEVHSKDRVGRNVHGEVDSVPIPFGVLTEADMEYLATYAAYECRGWSLIFSQDEHIPTWQSHMVTLDGGGTRYFRSMVWIKPNAKPNLNGDGPGKAHEMIQAYWSGPGRTKWNGGGTKGVFIHSRAHTQGKTKRVHPTEKPVSLMKELIRLFTNPGDVIFDPFMGSGSTGVAAIELGRKFIGIEKNIDYYDIAWDRITEALSKNQLFVPHDDKPPTLFDGAKFGSTGTKRRLRREAKENATP